MQRHTPAADGLQQPWAVTRGPTRCSYDEDPFSGGRRSRAAGGSTDSPGPKQSASPMYRVTTDRNVMHEHRKPKATTRIVAVVVSLAALMLTGIGAAGAASAAPAQVTDPTTVPVSGTLANGTGTVDGTLD